MSSTTNPTIRACEYTICPMNNQICRIRFDLEKFMITLPATSTATTKTLGGSTGDCTTDMFSITSGGSSASPTICGLNSGQHLYVDVTGACVKPAFFFGYGTTARYYTIKTMQYTCNDEYGGPYGCGQYFYATSGTVASFNYPLGQSTVDSSYAHLSSQHYDICFRRAKGYCSLCLYPTINTATPASFGLSVAGASTNLATTDTNCGVDYLVIPTFASTASDTSYSVNSNRICGRQFTTSTTAAEQKTICTAKRPFKLTFRTNADEAVAADAANTNENNGTPKGIIGFSLNFYQVAC